MIDDFDLMPQEEPFDPFAVMLFKALQVLAFLFFIALLAIAPEAKDGKVDSKAEFLVTMAWPDQHPDDFDMFVQDPIGNHGLVSTARGRASCFWIATIVAAPMISFWSTAARCCHRSARKRSASAASSPANTPSTSITSSRWAANPCRFR